MNKMDNGDKGHPDGLIDCSNTVRNEDLHSRSLRASSARLVHKPSEHDDLRGPRLKSHLQAHPNMLRRKIR